MEDERSEASDGGEVVRSGFGAVLGVEGFVESDGGRAAVRERQEAR